MDVVVLPTYREGFPNVPLEAAAMSLPVVATNVEGCVDAVEDGRTGLLVPPRDAEALARAIRTYLTDPDLRSTHGSHGRARVLEDFRQEAIWEALHDEYTKQVRYGEVSASMSGPKRAFDLLIASLTLIVLAPVLAVVGLLIRVRMGSPVLFRQRRPGLMGRPFVMHKFRTMIDAEDEAGNPLVDEERLTALGRFLRRTSLDELPELWNVVRGEMSLVGPRPLLMEYLPLYSPDQARRHDVRPGITGWAQINGRNATTWERRLELDAWYVSNRSFSLDMQILLRTLKKVIVREGINQEGSATMQRFRGSTI
jgi:lipopolysaccharide/colanic/teichoic acid biosynthesis glycosyltransferase